MKIVVCVKEIMDPEVLSEDFKVDAAKKVGLAPPGTPTVLSPFDAQAVEAALRIKEAIGATVTVITLGAQLHREVVKKPLAMGADELILLEDPAFADFDGISTAKALARAIEKLGGSDLVLCGRQAADWDHGQVGLGIAHHLRVPGLTLAKKIAIADGRAQVERVIPDGYEVVETPLPAVITVSNELGEPRYPTAAGIMASFRRQPIVWSLKDLGLPEEYLRKRTTVMRLYQPIRDGICEFVEGESLEEAARSLALRVREQKIL